MLRQRHNGVVCLWVLAIVVGSAPLTARAQWTVVNLHPPGAVESRCFGTHGAQQVGQADFGGSRAILWTGAVGTWMDLHPTGTTSDLEDAVDGQQVGAVQIAGSGHASLWTGTPGSWVDLHPLGATFSSTGGIGEHSLAGVIEQVGAAFVGGIHRASLWSGSAASWVDLHPPAATFSIAYDTDEGEQVGMAVLGGTPTASLWTGTSASWVSLHPLGAVTSSATGVHGGEQVGFIDVGGNVSHAGRWSGTAASWIDLHPAGTDSSEAHDVYGGRQAGEVRLAGGPAHASVWSGTAASWEDLHPYLGPAYTGGASSARGIWSDGTTTYVAGYAFNTALSRYEAILWVETATAPSHDLCSAALSVGDGPTVFHNIGATTDGPAESMCLPVGFNGMDDSDVWYEYVAGCEGYATIEVHGGSFDVLAGVYSGSCGGTLLGCELAPVGGHAFGMTVPVVPGETFIVRLGGLPGNQGVGSLNLQCIPSMGACCDPASVCTEVSPSSCASIGGTYYGDFSTCATTPCPPPAPQIDFAAPTNVATGSLPGAVVAGDFDLDGDNDLVVCNRGDQTFTVLRNDGSGSFQFTYGVAVASQQEDAFAADLDADGDLDLALAAEGVRLYRNVGGLGFWMTHNVGSTDVRAIIAEDFDGDCSIDLATANSNPPGNDVTVLLNVNGDFTQPTLTHYSAGTNPTDLAAADIDQDGTPDIVVANGSSGNVTVLYNNGSGVFSSSTNFSAGLGCCLTALAVGDLDGDLLPDVVLTHSGGTQISVLFNNGVGGLSSPTIVGVGNSPWDVAVADLDGDEDLDVLLVISNSPYQIVVLTNDGSGAFYAPLTFNVGTGPQKLAVAQFDGAQDGALDVAVTVSVPEELAVLLNVGDQDCNANSVADDTEATASLNFTIAGASNATPCSFRVYGSGFDIQGEFCVTSGAGPSAFVNEVIEQVNQSGCPGIRAERIVGLTDGFTVRAPGNSLDFCIGNAPGPATCCFSSTPVCSCNPDIEEFFFTGEDCNANGMDDAIDLYTGTSPDRNGDGIPDECASPCIADLNGTGVVNAADLALLLGSWGPCPGCVADLDGNDVVNAADLALLLGNWGPCGPSQ